MPNIKVNVEVKISPYNEEYCLGSCQFFKETEENSFSCNLFSLVLSYYYDGCHYSIERCH